jgi:hypothetical protein
MVNTVTTWFKAQFVDKQTWRDEDLEHWWQMPDDRTRTVSPWLQLLVDLVTRATFSDWHEKIAEARVHHYDRLRPSVTRLLLLCAVIAGLCALGPAWWIWALLLPAAAQVILEIYLHQYIAVSAPEPRWQWVQRMRDMVRGHFQTMMLNVTGILGTLACPLNVLAVCMAPAGGAHGWVKVAALAASILYVNSGLASAFLDPPNYTENSVMPPVMHRLRPFAPLISYLVVTGLVALTVAPDRWEQAMIPIGYLCAALTLLLGSTLRNHDRMIGAAAIVGRTACEEARKELGGVVHDDLNSLKAAANSVRNIPGVAYSAAIELEALEAYLSHFSAQIDIFAAPRMELSHLVGKLIGPYGISPRGVGYDIDWDEKNIRLDNHRVSIKMATALVHNVGQALSRDGFENVPKKLTLQGFTTGEDRELRYHLAVRDHLPVIPEEQWCIEGGTLAALRAWLRDKYHGDLQQDDLGDGTKRIVASWLDRPPITGYGEPSLEAHGAEK